MSEARDKHEIRMAFAQRLTGEAAVDADREEIALLVADAMEGVLDAFQQKTGLFIPPELCGGIITSAHEILETQYRELREVLAKRSGGVGEGVGSGAGVGDGGKVDGGGDVSGGEGADDGAGGGVGAGVGDGKADGGELPGEPTGPAVEADDGKSLYERIPLTTLAEGALTSQDGDMGGLIGAYVPRGSRNLRISELPDLQKSLRVTEVLQSLGVDLKTCHRYEGPSGVLGCKIIEATVGGRKKLILVSDLLGISTFVAHDGDIADFAGKDLRVWHDGFKKGKVSRLFWVKGDEYIEGWKERLSEFLRAESGQEWGVTDPNGVKMEMDANYFNNGRYVKSDLLKFVIAIGVDSPFELTTGGDSLWGTRIKCTNGEYLNGETYLLRAAKAHGYEKKGVRNYHYGKALSMLMTVAGYRVRDKSYYLDSRAVMADFQAFLEAYNVLHPGEEFANVNQLTANNMSGLSIVCQNGENASGFNYLRKVCILFGFRDTQFAKALGKLREIVSDAAAREA